MLDGPMRGGRRRGAGGRTPAGDRLASRRGVTAVIVVLCLIPLTGILTLAVDVGLLYRARRNAQTAADAAALAYAWECYRQNVNPASTTSCTSGGLNTTANAALVSAAASNGYTTNSDHRSVTAAAASWPSGGTNPAIAVAIQDTVAPIFGRVLGLAQTVVNARATATWDLAPSTGCMMALNPSAAKAFDGQGTPAVSAAGCQVVINSTASNAGATGGSATVTAGAIAVTGGTSGSGFSPTPSTGVPPSLNPLANVSLPSTIATCGSAGTYTATVNQQPGDAALSFAPPAGGTTLVFCNPVSFKGTANFAAGTYIFRQGLTVTSQGTVTGTGVTFVNAPISSPSPCNVTKSNPDCALDIQAGASLNVSAPTSGAYKGILLHQAAPDPFASVWANSTSTINGTVYLPRATLKMGGNSNMTVTGQVIADKIELSGTSTLTINAPTAATGGYFPGKRVALVD